MTTVTGGPFRSMLALGSGTALQPASTPMNAWHFGLGSWTLRYVNAASDWRRLNRRYISVQRAPDADPTINRDFPL